MPAILASRSSRMKACVWPRVRPRRRGGAARSRSRSQRRGKMYAYRACAELAGGDERVAQGVRHLGGGPGGISHCGGLVFCVNSGCRRTEGADCKSTTEDDRDGTSTASMCRHDRSKTEPCMVHRDGRELVRVLVPRAVVVDGLPPPPPRPRAGAETGPSRKRSLWAFGCVLPPPPPLPPHLSWLALLDW